jgi:YHS domain-containing protein
MKFTVTCDWCGRSFEREAAALKGKKHHFCCRQCLADFSSRARNPEGYVNLKDYTNMSSHMTQLNEAMNPDRMTPETRSKLRSSRLGKGRCDGYSKIYSKAAHRVVAEQIIGRPLKDGEVVHHRDENKYNNLSENLVIFPSQSAHVRYHIEMKWFISEIKKIEEEGDAK